MNEFKSYLLVFDLGQGPRQEILDYLNTLPAVKNWYAFMPTAVIIISPGLASEIVRSFRLRFPTRNLMVTELPFTNNDGWLDQKIWDFINNPKSSGRWPD